MEHRDSIFNEVHDSGDGYDVTMSLTSIYDDEIPQFTLDFRALERTEDQKILLRIQSTITSSLDLNTIANVVGVFGVCVAGKVGSSIGKVIYQSYQSSKANKPRLDPFERAKDTLAIVVSKRPDIQGEAVKAILDCLPIPKP